MFQSFTTSSCKFRVLFKLLENLIVKLRGILLVYKHNEKCFDCL